MKDRLEVLEVIGKKVLGEELTKDKTIYHHFLNMVNVPNEKGVLDNFLKGKDLQSQVAKVLYSLWGERKFEMLKALKVTTTPLKELFSEDELKKIFDLIGSGKSEKELLSTFDISPTSRLKFYIGLVSVLGRDCLPFTEMGGLVRDLRNVDFYFDNSMEVHKDNPQTLYITDKRIASKYGGSLNKTLVDTDNYIYIRLKHEDLFEGYKYAPKVLRFNLQSLNPELDSFIEKLLSGNTYELDGVYVYPLGVDSYNSLGFSIKKELKNYKDNKYLTTTYISDIKEVMDREEVAYRLEGALPIANVEEYLNKCDEIAEREFLARYGEDKNITELVVPLYVKKIENVEGEIDTRRTYSYNNIYTL